MKLLIAAPDESEIGGVASVVRNLSEYLQSRGHDVYFLYPARTVFLKNKVTKANFPAFELRMQAPFGERNAIVSLCAFLLLFPITFCQVLYLVKKHRFQFINIHYLSECFFYLALCRRILSIKTVISVHGSDIFPDGRPQPRCPLLSRFLLSSSDIVVAPSKKFRQDFLRIFPQLERKTIFIHNGINASDLTIYKTRPARRGPYILTVSTCKAQKAIDVLLRAFKRPYDLDRSLKLLIVGDGPLHDDLANLTVSLGIQDRTEFLGWKEREEVAQLLHGCEVFVLPSRFETFGIVILEAWACNKPVVATTAGGIPEIVENGKNGILVEADNPNALGDALINVLEDRALRLAIAANGYATLYQRFLREHTGSAYETVFADLLLSAETKKKARTNLTVE